MPGDTAIVGRATATLFATSTAPDTECPQWSVLSDVDHPSRLMLPLVPLHATALGPPRPCRAQDGLRCCPGP